MKILLQGLLSFVFFTFFMLQASAALAGWYQSPKIFGDYVVALYDEDFDGVNTDLVLYKISTGSSFNIVTGLDVWGYEIWDHYVVYGVNTSAGSGYDAQPDLFVYDISAKSTTNISNTPTLGEYAIDVWDGKVVYSQGVSILVCSDIFIYELSTGITTQAQLPDEVEKISDLSTNGSFISLVYTPGMEQTTPTTLGLYTINDSSFVQIAQEAYRPDLTDGYLVYVNQDSPRQIYLYNITAGTTVQLAPTDEDQWEPQIVDGSDLAFSPTVVWYSGPDENYDIWLKRGMLNSPIQITTDPHYQGFPSIHNSNIVYESWKGSSAYEDTEIQLYNIGTGKTECILGCVQNTNTANVFLQGFSFESRDDHRAIEAFGFYVGDVHSPCEDSDSGELCFVAGKNATLESDTKHDFQLWYQTLLTNDSVMGFYNGEINSKTTDGTDSFIVGYSDGTTPISVGEDQNIGAYDYYAVVIRGFFIDYSNDKNTQFETITVKGYLDRSTSNNITTESAVIQNPGKELKPQFSIQSHGHDQTNSFDYTIKYTIVGFNTNRVAYGEDRPTDWQIKSTDGNTKTYNSTISMYDFIGTDDIYASSGAQIVIPATSGFTIRAYDPDNGTSCDAREVYRLGFHYGSGASYDSMYKEASFTLYGTGNLNGDNAGAAFKVNTVLFAIFTNDYSYTTREGLDIDNTQSGTKSYSAICGESETEDWSCTQIAN